MWPWFLTMCDTEPHASGGLGSLLCVTPSCENALTGLGSLGCDTELYDGWQVLCLILAQS